MQDDIKFLVALAHFPKFGPVRLQRLKSYFPDWGAAFRADFSTLKQAGIEEAVAQEFIASRANIHPDKILEILAKEGIKTTFLGVSSYPPLLKEIFNPPHLLYYKGTLIEDESANLAVVGTRKFTPYGKRVVEDIIRKIASQLTIVSGLAIGIDTLAHNTALAAKGRTIAVLGSGLDKANIYPAQNRYLAEKIIAEGGALVSEFNPGTPALKHHFPQRNRIVSGLSLGTLVIEADQKSGSLITAKFALEQNREVFAVPGSIYSQFSLGTNSLIREGAKAVLYSEDIAEGLNLEKVKMFVEAKKIIPESQEEKMILEFLGKDSKHVNEIVRSTKLDMSKINSTLTIMEMKGMVKNLGGMMYVVIL